LIIPFGLFAPLLRLIRRAHHRRLSRKSEAGGYGFDCPIRERLRRVKIDSFIPQDSDC